MTFGAWHNHCQELALLHVLLAIKRSTVIDKFSLRLGEGGSCVNIIMTLSVTLTSL